MKSALGLEASLRARSYRGTAQAVLEITQGTAHFMSHKKAVAFIVGQTSELESLLPYYYKELYQVQKLSHLQTDTIHEWVEGLKKDTNFVLFSEDHPVTGELYAFVDELDKLLNEKRIFSFRISHFNHFQNAQEVRPYTVRICSYSETAAVAVLGKSFRSPPLGVQNMPWEAKLFLNELAQSRASHLANPGLVEKFEKEIVQIADLFFKTDKERLFDRAVIIFKDVSADAIAETLFKKLGLSSEEGWQKMSTTNLCHWSTIKMFRHWWEPQPTEEELRGLLVIGTEFLNIKDFAKLMITSYEEVKAQQSWNL
ncbi:MAG: hypothetical protein ACXVCR_05545 [Bdellovibrio sp.]